MSDFDSDCIEFYVRVGRDEFARARHDQPAIQTITPEQQVIECPNDRCNRSIRVVPIAGAEQYFCPHCDADLDFEQPGGVR